MLEALNAAPSPLGISSLSSSLRLGKSNVHRMLTTLSHLGFVRQEEETKRYFPTLKSWELGTQVVERNLIRRGARTILRELVAATDESTYLSVLRDTEILYLEKLEGKKGAHSASRPGLRVPAILPASGKLLLALQPNWEAIADRAIAHHSEVLQVDRKVLLAELAAIREQRFATSIDGTQKGTNSLALPIGSADRPPVAALGFAMMPSRWDPKRLQAYRKMLDQAAQRIALMLETSDDPAI